MNDVRQWIFGAIIGLLACIGLMLSIVYVSACGFTVTCVQASPLVIRTPVPTLIPAAHTADLGSSGTSDFSGCLVSAQDLVGAWVTAGGSEAQAFPFTSVSGQSCEATYANDVQYLFVDNNIWSAGQLGCTSCHNADLTDRSGGIDLSSHQAIVDSGILGDGNWESSRLHAVLVDQGFVPEGHSSEAEPLAPVLIYAGQQVDEPVTPEVTPTATP